MNWRRYLSVAAILTSVSAIAIFGIWSTGAWSAIVFSIPLIILLGYYMFSSVGRTLKLEKTEAALRESYDGLMGSAMGLEVRAQQLALLAELSDMVQGCKSRDDGLKAISIILPQIFAGTSGALYLLEAKGNMALAKIHWGDGPVEESFDREACAGLRSEGVHLYNRQEPFIECGHTGGMPPATYTCVPMLAEGKPFGLLYVSTVKRIDRETDRMAQAVAENLALAISNIDLRTTLKEQSITDPLTKLFNRRFIGELFDREIHRAGRHNACIGVLIIDIDYFKKVNDTYGHAAGDAVLETLAEFLRTGVRAEDYVCRYGGEEFLLIFPGGNKSDTYKRAEEIREKTAVYTFLNDGKDIGPINLSGGVAEYPADGIDKDSIIKAADEALYTAKKTGRNRIIKAGAAKG